MNRSTAFLIAAGPFFAAPLSAQAPPLVQNPGVALLDESPTESTVQSRTMIVVHVHEHSQGADLNGDGDLNDPVAFVHDLRTGTARNLGHAVRPTSRAAVSDRYVVSAVLEQSDGPTDWNGDGDTLDSVAFLFDRATGQTRSLGLALAGKAEVSDRYLALPVSETGQGGTDLDGNGVLSVALVMFDLTTGAVVIQGQPFFTSGWLETYFAISGSRVYWMSATNQLITTYDFATGVTTGLGLRTNNAPVTRGGLVAFQMVESFNGVDFNGDGDMADGVLAVVPSGGGAAAVVLLGGPGGSLEESVVDEHTILGSRNEVSEATDWNGDGDRLDNVWFLYDDRTGVLTNLGRANVRASEPDGSDRLLGEVRGDVVAYAVSEPGEGQDRNGDGDMDDRVLEVRNLSGTSVINVGVAVTNQSRTAIQISRGLVGFLVPEFPTGPDLDGDGVFNSMVPHVFDPRQPTTPPLNLGRGIPAGAANTFHFDQGRAAFLTREAPSDLTGDGDTSDYVLVVRGITPGSMLDTALAAFAQAPFDVPPVRGYRGAVLMRVSEVLSGADQNGDGDLQDAVLSVVRLNP